MDADENPPGAGLAQTFGITRRVGVVELCLAGEIDVATAPVLVAAVEDAIADGCRSVTVDLDAVTFMDAAGVGALVHAQKEMTGQGGELVLVCNSPTPRRLLHLTQMETAFGLVRTDRWVRRAERRLAADAGSVSGSAGAAR